MTYKTDHPIVMGLLLFMVVMIRLKSLFLKNVLHKVWKLNFNGWSIISVVLQGDSFNIKPDQIQVGWYRDMGKTGFWATLTPLIKTKQWQSDRESILSGSPGSEFCWTSVQFYITSRGFPEHCTTALLVKRMLCTSSLCPERDKWNKQLRADR